MSAVPRFVPYEDDSDIGKIEIPMSARMIINDGQHRKAAIDEAVNQYPELGEDQISVILFATKAQADSTNVP